MAQKNKKNTSLLVGMKELVHRRDKWINVGGDYMKKLHFLKIQFFPPPNRLFNYEITLVYNMRVVEI